MDPARTHAARDASRHVWLAEAHLQYGRIGKGIEELDAAALALAAARDDRAYVAVAKRILALAPNRIDMLRGLASAQLRWGDVEGAGQTVVAWLALRPGASEAIEAMAEVFGRRGRRDKAAKTLARLALRELGEGKPGVSARLCDRARSWDDRDHEVIAVANRLAELEIPTADSWGSLTEDFGVAPSRSRARSGQTISARAVGSYSQAS